MRQNYALGGGGKSPLSSRLPTVYSAILINKQRIHPIDTYFHKEADDITFFLGLYNNFPKK